MLTVFKSGTLRHGFSEVFQKALPKCRSSIAGIQNRKWLDSLRVNVGNRFYTYDSKRNIVNSPMGDLKMPNLPFHEYITENWILWERKMAVECVKSGKRYTYKSLRRHSKALAAAFQNKLNLSKGDVIGLVLSNCPEYPIIILAASLNGVIPTTANPNSSTDEIHSQLDECKVKLVITDVKAYEKCVAAVKIMKASFPILVVKHRRDDELPQGTIDLCELFNRSISGSFKEVDIEMDDVFALPYSSGVTGMPRAASLTHANVVSNLAQLSHPETNFKNSTTRFSQDRTLIILPMFHIFGMIVCAFSSLREGCRLFILPSFNNQILATSIYQKKVNFMYLVPPLLNVLGQDEVKRKHLMNLEFIVNGASSLCLRDAYAVLEKAEHLKIVQGYGLTETSPVVTHTSTRRMQKLSSVGVPIAATKIKVVHPETQEILPSGQQGELCVWGPQVMKSYYNRPEDTTKSFDKEGWLKTGDIGYYDSDKDFFIVQKLKDVMRIEGYKVSPFEVEELLKSHPKILDAAVVGVMHPHRGEVPRAYVILKNDQEMMEKEVKDFIESKLPEHKHLTGGVRFVDDFPKNQVGRLLRLELKKMS